MPFKEAKTHVEKKVAPQIKESKSILMETAYENLLDKFDDHTKKATKYIDDAKYKGHEKDKQDYLAQIKKSTDKFLEKKGGHKEFIKYSVNIDIRSDKLHDKIQESIKQHEKEKFQKVREMNSELLKKGDFNEALRNLMGLNMSLSSLNTTGSSGNLDEREFRLDKQIEKRIAEIKQIKNIYNTVLQPDNVLMFGKTKGVAIYEIRNGKVGFSEYDKLKLGPEVDMKTFNSDNLDWWDFLEKYKIGTFKVGKLDYNKGKIKRIEIKKDAEVENNLAEITELKSLKEVNHIYGGGLERQIENPAQKEALKKALSENFNSLRMYFDKDKNGHIRPTEIFRSSNDVVKMHKMMLLKQGYKPILERLQLEQAAVLQEDPKMKMFMEGEVAFRKGLHMQAYGKLRKFIKQNKNNPKYANQIKIARQRLKTCSIQILKVGHNYLGSCLAEPEGNQAFYLGEGFRKHMQKRLAVWISGLAKVIDSGKAWDLDAALSMVPHPLEGHGNYPKKLGRTETNFITFHFNKFLKKFIKTAEETDKEKQKDMLLKQGDKARKDKYFQGATVLYREYMREGMQKNQKERNKDGKLWKLKRLKLLALTGNKKAKSEMQQLWDQMKFTGKMSLTGPDGTTDLEKMEVDAKALQKAYEAAGDAGKEFDKLPKTKQKELLAHYRQEIALKIIKQDESGKNFLQYVKNNQILDMAALNYNDMADPFDETWNVSDKGWEGVKILAQELPVDVAIMAVSAGVGTAAANTIRGARKIQLIQKLLTSSRLMRFGMSATTFAVDLAASEFAEQMIRRKLLGQKLPTDIKSLIAHSLGMYGGMKYIAGTGQKALMKAGLGGRTASVVSLFGIEAPWAMGISNILGEGQGSLGEQYGHSVLNMLKGRFSMGLMNKFTGGRLMKQEQRYYEDMQRYKAESAQFKKEQTAAKDYLNTNKTKIRQWFKKENAQRAFVEFMINCQGSYAKFRNKFEKSHPHLVKALPKDLLKLKFLPIPVLALSVGINFEMRSLNDAFIGTYFQKGQEFDFMVDGKLQKFRVEGVDLNTNKLVLMDYTLGRRIEVDNHQWQLAHMKQMHEIGSHISSLKEICGILKKKGFKDDADGLMDISYIEKNHAEVVKDRIEYAQSRLRILDKYEQQGIKVPKKQVSKFVEMMDGNSDLGKAMDTLLKQRQELLEKGDHLNLRAVEDNIHDIAYHVFGKKTKKILPQLIAIKSQELKLYGDLSLAESQSILQQTEIRGDKYKGNRLTREQLAQAGLSPKYTVDTAEGSMFISAPFMAETRTAFIVYTQSEKGIVARTYYLSGSHGMWKYLPNYTTKKNPNTGESDPNGGIAWYGKSMSQEAITAPFQLQKKLSQLAAKVKPVDTGGNWDYYFAGTTKRLKYSGEHNPGHSIYKEVGWEPMMLPGNLANRVGGKLPPEQVKISNAANKPDFSRRIDSYTNEHPAYGEIKNEVYLSHDGIYKYVFCTDGQGRTWIGNIQANKARIGSTGVRSMWVDAGDLTTPAFDYREEAGGYGNLGLQHGNYVDMYQKYVSKIPLIKEYKAMKSGKAPKVSPQLRQGSSFDFQLTKNHEYPLDIGGRTVELKLGPTKKLYIEPSANNGFIIKDESGASMVLADNTTTTFGREAKEQALRFNYPDTVSGYHMTIRRQGNQIYIKDSSSNGTHARTIG